MDLTVPLSTLSLWFFLSKKFSKWVWVGRLEDKLPLSVWQLLDAWKSCAFCGGFWIALVVQFITGRSFLGLTTYPVVCLFLDALSSAMVSMIAVRLWLSPREETWKQPSEQVSNGIEQHLTKSEPSSRPSTRPGKATGYSPASPKETYTRNW